MSLQNIVGLDHVVVLTRELDTAAETWRRLGFTLSPRGTHSAHLGSGNYTIMFDPDYIELLGILTPTAHNEPSRAYLHQRGEGLERAAFTAVDAEALAAELKALGLAAAGPIDFSRPVTLPSGAAATAAFRVTQWPDADAPAGLRIFACQHLTRDAVWIPELMRHANTAERILRVEILAEDALAEAQRMAKLIDRSAETDAGGAVTVETGNHRAPFVFLSREEFTQRHPNVPLTGLPASGAVALVLAVADLSRTAAAVGPDAIFGPGAVTVPPAKANGVLLKFVSQ